MREAIAFVGVVAIVIGVAHIVTFFDMRSMYNHINPSWEYTVQAGESLLDIVERYYPSEQARDVIEEMYKLNVWMLRNELHPGDIIRMPPR